MSIIILCYQVSNQNSHWESVFVGHHVVAGHLPGQCLVVAAGPDVIGEVVDVDE